ncbi:hypothetical protein sos41_30110 [Alphaproteobacteria bacterium SO-S41]|nr:hypothetical protein sos41_30110 [Alphaproteobacteria bacterium SO-S41]
MPQTPDRSAAFRRFQASTNLDYDMWKEGTPYDIAALDEMSAEERDVIAREIAEKSNLDWRDVEALKRIATPYAKSRVQHAGLVQTDGGGAEAFADEAEANWNDAIEQRFIEKLGAMRLMESSTDRMYEIALAHPTPAVRAALYELAISGDETMRYSYGAALLYITGHAGDSYGLSNAHRPHLLDLKGDTEKERTAAAAWLKAKADKPKKRPASEA